jgi:hypothetical protein
MRGFVDLLLPALFLGRESIPEGEWHGAVARRRNRETIACDLLLACGDSTVKLAVGLRNGVRLESIHLMGRRRLFHRRFAQSG